MNNEIDIILEKVQSIYQKQGIKSVTMDDVAHELGISKKTLYQYVEDKSDLVKRILEREIEQGRCYFSDVKDRALNAIEEMIEVHMHINLMIKRHNPTTEFDLKKYYPELYHPFIEERRSRMFNWVVNNIKKGKAEGFYRPEVNENIIAKLVVSRNELLNEADFNKEHEFNSQEFFRETLNYHIRGIAKPEGVALYEEIKKQKDIR